MSLITTMKRCARKAFGPSVLINLRHQLTGHKIERNQWLSPRQVETYERLMRWSWEETQSQAPDYFSRLSFAVAHAHGRVLELGCGIGTMTRFLAASPDVTEVIAVDSFEGAIAALKSYNLPKTIPVRSTLERLELPCEKVDTLLACELLEHLYADEERQLLENLKAYVIPGTRYLISVPIGWLQDPCHVRSFSKSRFKKHLATFYGPPVEVDYSSGYSQSAWGYFKGRP